MQNYCRLVYIILSMSLLLSCKGVERSDVYLEKGVSIELAEYRAEHLSEIKYDLFFYIPHDRTCSVDVIETVEFSLDNTENDLILDFKGNPERIKSVNVNGFATDISYLNEHLVISKEYLKSGPNIIDISFTASNKQLNRHHDYLYTLVVPDRARGLFPCFDQPDLKARFSLSLMIPSDWSAVSNAPVLSEIPVNRAEFGTRSSSANNFGYSSPQCRLCSEQKYKLIKFRMTEPISTMKFAFAAGVFDKSEMKNPYSMSSGLKGINIYYRQNSQTDSRLLGRISQEIFKSVQWLEKFTKIRYPFAKYDIVILPDLLLNSAGHPGITLYNDSGILIPENADINQLMERSHLIAHEMANLWFGDFVTFRWPNELWLMEGVSNFIASKILAVLYPETDFKTYDLNYYIKSYDEDRTPGAASVYQKLDNIRYAKLIYNNSVYDKSPIFLNNLYRKMGQDAFWKSIQEYMTTYAYGNASWNDLKSILCNNQPDIFKGTDADINHLCDYWVYEKGLPLKNINIQNENESVINDIPNLDGEYYGYIRLNDEALNLVINRLYDRDKTGNFRLPSYSRKSLLVMLHENWINENLSSEKFLRVLISFMYEETDPQLFPLMVSYISEVAVNSITDPGSTYTEEVVSAEDALFNFIHDCKNPYFCKVAFKALNKIAQSPRILLHTFKLWNHEISHETLVLNENDYTELALALAFKLNLGIKFIDGISPYEIILSQRGQITDSERLREFDFVSRVCYYNDRELDMLFESLLNDRNRHVEFWVCTVLEYLNHPLRQDKALKYIIPGLNVLEDINDTGSIFFPSRWTHCLLSGHNSIGAKQIIRTFLDRNNDMHPLLKNRIRLYL